MEEIEELIYRLRQAADLVQGQEHDVAAKLLEHCSQLCLDASMKQAQKAAQLADYRGA